MSDRTKLPTWGEVIADTAEDLAWSKKTSQKRYKYNYSKTRNWSSWEQLGYARPTKAFMKAHDKVRPKHFKIKYRSSSSNPAKVGASCDVFVGVVVRASGYDKHYPFGLQTAWDNEPTKKYPKKWKKVKCVKKNLKRGDIFQYNYRKYNSGHTYIWLGNGKMAEAGLGRVFGHIKNAPKNPCSTGDKTKFIVRRAIG